MLVITLFIPLTLSKLIIPMIYNRSTKMFFHSNSTDNIKILYQEVSDYYYYLKGFLMQFKQK